MSFQRSSAWELVKKEPVMELTGRKGGFRPTSRSKSPPPPLEATMTRPHYSPAENIGQRTWERKPVSFLLNLLLSLEEMSQSK